MLSLVPVPEPLKTGLALRYFQVNDKDDDGLLSDVKTNHDILCLTGYFTQQTLLMSNKSPRIVHLLK